MHFSSSKTYFFVAAITLFTSAPFACCDAANISGRSLRGLDKDDADGADPSPELLTASNGRGADLSPELLTAGNGPNEIPSMNEMNEINNLDEDGDGVYLSPELLSDSKDRDEDPRRRILYPAVTIYNDTPYDVQGEVKYISWLCSDDNFYVRPKTTWTGPSRGVCLISNIGGYGIGSGRYAGNTYRTIDYNSSGTSYSTFEVELQNGRFVIDRYRDNGSVKYNCYTREAWSHSKRQWCCANKIGC